MNNEITLKRFGKCVKEPMFVETAESRMLTH